MSDINTPERHDYEQLSPFKLFVKSNFPFIEATFEALDNYGLYCEIVKYLNQVIDEQNKTSADIVTFTDFVTNYFNDLDVQEEINNKLDDMVQDGSLSEIIGEYVDSEILPQLEYQNTLIQNQSDRITSQGTEVNRNTDAIETLKTRVDSFTHLAEGTTTADAEIIDARIGYNGIEYDSLGESIRTQIEDVYKGIDQIATREHTNLLTTVERYAGEYYIFESHNVAENADFCRFGLIPVKAGVTYYFKHIFGNFTSIRYVDNTWTRITTTTGNANGSFTPTKDGMIGITGTAGATTSNTLFTDDEEMYNNGLFNSQILPNLLNSNLRFIVDKSGNGDFTKLSDAINFVNDSNLMDATLIVGSGTWDIINELGSEFIETIGFYNRGLVLKNRIHLKFASDSKVTCNYQGSTSAVCQWLSAFNSGPYGFTLENCRIEASNCRYCVHDERDQDSDVYHNYYINCSMYMNNSSNQYTTAHQCIGGGLGLDGHISISGCDFESVNTSTPGWTFNPVSYHNSLNAGQSRIDITNCYFKTGTVRLSYYGTSTKITHAFVSNCSFTHSILYVPETSQSTNVNVDVTEWNNIIRQ